MLSRRCVLFLENLHLAMSAFSAQNKGLLSRWNYKIRMELDGLASCKDL